MNLRTSCPDALLKALRFAKALPIALGIATASTNAFAQSYEFAEKEELKFAESVARDA